MLCFMALNALISIFQECISVGLCLSEMVTKTRSLECQRTSLTLEKGDF